MKNCLLSELFIIIILFTFYSDISFSQWKSDEEVFENVFKNNIFKFITSQHSNLKFYFQKDSYSFGNSNKLIEQTLNALDSNSRLLNTKVTDTMDVVFLNTTEQMKILTGSKAKGWALPSYNCILIVVNDTTRPYLKHELMHLVSVKALGPSEKTSFWINEGLSVYAEENCMEHSLDELCAFFLHKNYFLNIDTLQNNFWDYPDMLTYMESGFIVQYLVTTYGIDKFKKLWNEPYPKL